MKNKIDVNKQMIFYLVSKLQNITLDDLETTCIVMHNTVNDDEIEEYNGFLQIIQSIDPEKIQFFFDVLKYIMRQIKEENIQVPFIELLETLLEKSIITKEEFNKIKKKI